MTKRTRKATASKQDNSPSSPALPFPGNLEMVAALVFLAVSLGYAIWAASAGWYHTLNDHHSFRQTQTAITAYYLREQPFQLAYETPIMGPPWSIPMEFPVYQWLVARLSNAASMPLDQAGRFVNLSFFLFSAFPLYSLLRSLRVTAAHSLLVLCLFFTSPFYLFWSRSFLIESTALFFGLAYAACLCKGLERNSKALLIAAMATGVLAGLTKITTWLPLAAGTSILLLAYHLRWPVISVKRTDWVRLFLHGILVVGIPFLFAYAWVRYADHIKAANPLASTHWLSSLPSQRTWNFGTIEQKLSATTWSIILGRAGTVVGYPMTAWVLIYTASIAVAATRRRWREALICLALFLFVPLVFTNLHVVHDYYMYANGVFLLGVLAMGVVALLESRRARVVGWILFLAIIWSSIVGHATIYRPVQEMKNQEILQLAEAVKARTRKDSVLVCVGAEMSIPVPYYCERKALLILEWDGMTETDVQHAVAKLAGMDVPIILYSPSAKYSLKRLKEQLASVGLTPQELTVTGIPMR